MMELEKRILALEIEVAQLRGFAESHGKVWQWAALCLFAFAAGSLLTMAISEIAR